MKIGNETAAGRMVRLPAQRRSLLLFVGSLVLSAPVISSYYVPLDEGTLVHVAERLAGGELLYRDVATGVMPGAYYLLALLYQLFGVSLTVGRVVQMVMLASTTALVYLLSRRFAGEGTSVLAAVLYFAVSVYGYRYPNYSPISIVPILIGVGLFLRAMDELEEGRLLFVLSGTAMGVGFLTKQNYGATVFVALMGALVLRFCWERSRRVASALVVFGAAFTLPVLVTVGAFVLAGAGREMFDYTVASIFSQTLVSFYKPYPFLGLDPFFFHEDLYNYSPFPPWIEEVCGKLDPTVANVLIGGAYWALPVILLAAAWRTLRRLWRGDVDWAELAMVGAAAALFTGVYPRSDYHHLTLVCSLPLVVGALLTRPVPSGSGDRAAAATVRRWVTRLALVAASVFAVASLLPPMLALVTDFPERQDTRLGLPRAGVVRLSAREVAEIRPVVEYVAAEVPETAPLLVVPDDAIYYLLTARRNPTPFPLALPGSFDEATFVAALEGVDVVLYQDLAYDGIPVSSLFPALFAELRSNYDVDPGFLDRLRDPSRVPVVPLRRRAAPRVEEGLLLTEGPGETRVVDVEGGVSLVDPRVLPRARIAPWLGAPALRLRPPSGWQKIVHSVRVRAPAGARLELAPAYLPPPPREGSDGAVLEVYVQRVADGETQRLLRRVFDPRLPDSWRPRQESLSLDFVGAGEALVSFVAYSGDRLDELNDEICVTEPRIVGPSAEEPVEGGAGAVAVPLEHYRRLGRFDDLTVFEEGAVARPDDPVVHTNLGLARARAGDTAGALESLGRAVTLDASRVDGQLALAEVLAGQGRWVEACDHYARLVELDPRHVRALAKLGDCALDVEGDLDRARRLGRLAEVREPGRLDVNLLLARVALATGRHEHALPHLERALAVAPGHPFVLEQLDRIAPGEGLVVGPKVLSRGRAPLERADFAAALTLRGPAPTRLAAGTSSALVVEVENRGAAVWPALGSAHGRYRFALGLRWIDREGRTADASRVALPHDVEPGETVLLGIDTVAPQPGSYALELALVESGAAEPDEEGGDRWWNGPGEGALRFEIEVVPAAGSS